MHMPVNFKLRAIVREMERERSHRDAFNNALKHG